MTEHDELRQLLIDAKENRNEALFANTQALNAGQPVPHTDADLLVLRLAVDVAALEARNAGVNIDDLAGPNVGKLDP